MCRISRCVNVAIPKSLTVDAFCRQRPQKADRVWISSVEICPLDAVTSPPITHPHWIHFLQCFFARSRWTWFSPFRCVTWNEFAWLIIAAGDFCPEKSRTADEAKKSTAFKDMSTHWPVQSPPGGTWVQPVGLIDWKSRKMWNLRLARPPPEGSCCTRHGGWFKFHLKTLSIQFDFLNNFIGKETNEWKLRISGHLRVATFRWQNKKIDSDFRGVRGSGPFIKCQRIDKQKKLIELHCPMNGAPLQM